MAEGGDQRVGWKCCRNLIEDASGKVYGGGKGYEVAEGLVGENRRIANTVIMY